MIDHQRHATAEQAAAALAAGLAEALSQGIATRGRASMALSGGNTPRLVLPRLAALPLDWPAVEATLIDERWVDADDSDSNERLVHDHLLQGNAAAVRFIGLKTAAQTPADGRQEVEDRLAAMTWPLDAVYLGLGLDGHIASLFPDDTGWQAAPGRCVAVPPGGGRLARISLTPAALLDSRRIFLIVVDPAKSAVLEQAMRPGSVEDLPARLVLHQDRVPVTVVTVAV